MLNPYICPYEGDLSRADVVVLTMLCRNKVVVEFGAGGSTVILSQVAKKVISYETEQSWIDKIKPLVGENTEIKLIEKESGAVSEVCQECDVLFDDGHSNLRAAFLLEFWPYVRECAILHDSRMTYPGNVLKVFIDKWSIKNLPSKTNPGNPDNPYLSTLDSIHWSYLESNMVVLKKRQYSLFYENWNVSEKKDTFKSEGVYSDKG